MGTYAGKYDNLLALYRPEQTQSSTGQVTNSFVEYVTEIPCSYEPWKGRSENEDNQRVSFNIFTFRMHYPHSFEVLSTMEIEYDGSRFKIDEIHESEKGRRVELVITATKKDN